MLRPETIKLLEDLEGKLLDISLGNDFFFLDLIPKQQKKWGATKAKTNKWQIT